MLSDRALWSSSLYHWILQPPLVHYSLSHFFSWHSIGLITFSTYVFYTSVSMTEKITQYICCFCEVLHHCHTSDLSEQGEFTFQLFTLWDLVCFSLQMLPSRAWYWNAMTGWSPPDDLYDAVTRQPVDMSASRLPSRTAPTWDINTLLLCCHPGFFIRLRCIAKSILKAPLSYAVKSIASVMPNYSHRHTDS